MKKSYGFAPTPIDGYKNRPNKNRKTVRGFTLIELLITISIIGIMTAISVPILVNQKDRTKNLESAVAVLKDAILATQNLAYAPQNENAKEYILFVNLSDVDQGILGGLTLEPNNYAILVYDGTIVTEVKTIPFYKNVTLSTDCPVGSTDVFAMSYRVFDKVAGFKDPASSVFEYYDSGGWDTLWDACGDFADIRVDYNGQIKTIKVQKMTGEAYVE
ncbi:hypothetical protein A2V71_04275 [Candidatus Berkelbacteria bacterium RBG_13_40_8]|uniref:Type II secretion system protein GspG C-terminal domain-containing protein n=1 Tax=Candidatus Berkelbacteria bacterium RBG_13_40_8 TaxID=1797467 RepID=A0A1F5DNV9_9BACT|nr:MAG: hypothetical protein A2V71_04275 [Candidatus Berkelbacteria bacterium RBG_13_40_8]